MTRLRTVSDSIMNVRNCLASSDDSRAALALMNRFVAWCIIALVGMGLVSCSEGSSAEPAQSAATQPPSLLAMGTEEAKDIFGRVVETYYPGLDDPEMLSAFVNDACNDAATSTTYEESGSKTVTRWGDLPGDTASRFDDLTHYASLAGDAVYLFCKQDADRIGLTEVWERIVDDCGHPYCEFVEEPDLEPAIDEAEDDSGDQGFTSVEIRDMVGGDPCQAAAEAGGIRNDAFSAALTQYWTNLDSEIRSELYGSRFELTEAYVAAVLAIIKDKCPEMADQEQIDVQQWWDGLEVPGRVRACNGLVELVIPEELDADSQLVTDLLNENCDAYSLGN